MLQFVLVLGILLAISITVSGDLVVDDDTGTWMNYDNIQDAIDNAADNETIYVYDGVYYENVIVNQTVNIVGNGTNDVMVYSPNDDSTFNVSADYVNITYLTVESNMTMDPKAAGIFIEWADHVRIAYCRVNDTEIGIFGYYANDAVIEFTGVYNCSDDGLYITHSQDVTMYQVRVENCDRSGIEGWHSDGMTINYADVYDCNTDDGADDGGFTFHYCDDLTLGYSQGDTNKRFGVLQRYAEDTFYYRNTMEDTIGGEGFYISSAVRVLFRWNDAYQNDGIGFWFTSANDGEISNNTAEDNGEHGFHVNGRGTLFADNNATENGWTGFYLTTFSGSDIVRCWAVNNTSASYDGFHIEYSRHVNITECVSKGNGRDGFQFLLYYGINMTNTTMADNGRYGLYLWALNGGVFEYNEIFDNTNYGLYSSASPRNITVRYNNFANNGGSSSQAYCGKDENNTFNGTGEGNYWSDWNGTGNYSIDGSAGLADEHPQGSIIPTSAPERVPEFAFLLVLTMMFIMAIVYRRREQ